MNSRLKALCFILSLLMALSLIACGAPLKPDSTAGAKPELSPAPAASTPPLNPSEPTAPALSVKDHAGRVVSLESAPERIVSGYYISSSLLIALGISDRLVGIEAKAESRPIYKLAAPRLLELKSVGSAKEFDLEGCISLSPELVILPARLKDIAQTLEGLGIAALLVNPESQDELNEAIRMIAAATRTDERGEALISYYDEKLKFMASLALADMPNEEKPTVYLVGGELLRTAPSMMYQNSVIENAHGVNAARDIEDNSWVDISYEQLIGYNPDYIMIVSESGVSVDDVMKDAQLSQINAVKNGNVYKMPTAFEAWDSPVPSGILGSLWMLSILHGGVYSFDAFEADAAGFYKSFYGVEIDRAALR